MSSAPTPAVASTRKEGPTAMSAARVEPRATSGDLRRIGGAVRLYWNRTLTLCLVELAKIRHDRAEIYTRAVQPVLWLVIFGVTFTRIHAIPTGNVPYL